MPLSFERNGGNERVPAAGAGPVPALLEWLVGQMLLSI